ncbi:M-phase-specific PLK1-interacting protein [Polypterus senegalus]
MYRQSFRHPAPPSNGGMVQRAGRFRSPPPGDIYGGGGGGGHASLIHSQAWGFPNSTSPTGGQGHWPYSGKSPNTPPKIFHGSNSGGGGSSMGRYSSPSPGHTPRRPSPRYTPPYGTSPGGHPYQQQQRHHHQRSPGQQRHYQGSPRTSTPFASARGIEKRVSNDVENYYRPSMLEDPWASLEPVNVKDINQQFSKEQTTNTGKRGRYFS